MRLVQLAKTQCQQTAFITALGSEAEHWDSNFCYGFDAIPNIFLKTISDMTLILNVSRGDVVKYKMASSL